MMLNSFIDEVRKQVQTEFKYASERMINDQLISMFVLKYYCDNGKYSYQELMMTDEMKDVLFPIDGIEDKILKAAGFTKREEKDCNIIPNYFEPFDQKNVDIWVRYKDKNTVFCKADGDQDRPRLIRY